MIDLNELRLVTLGNAELRNKNGGHIKTDTRSMLKHTATEVVEAMESFTVLSKSEIDDKFIQRYNFASELADIVCCVLIIAGKENIDIETAIFDCIEKNRKRAEGVGDKL